MAVCKFFLQGHCKFGNQCRFEHIRGGQDSGGYQTNSSRSEPQNFGNSGRGQGFARHPQQQSQSRPQNQSNGSRSNGANNFGNFNSQRGGHRGPPGRGRGDRGGDDGGKNRNTPNLGKSHAALRKQIQSLGYNSLQELAVPVQNRPPENPDWPFSCFAPGSELPNMITGTELSMEEHRWEVYQVERGMKLDTQVVLLLQCLAFRLDEQVNAIRQDPDEALRRYKRFYSENKLEVDFDILANSQLDPAVKDPMSNQELVFTHFKPPPIIKTNLLLNRPAAAVPQTSQIPINMPIVAQSNGNVPQIQAPNFPNQFQQGPVLAANVPAPPNLNEMELEQFSTERFQYLALPETEPPERFR